MRRQGSADVLSAVLATAGLTGGPTTGAAAVVAPAGFSDTLAYSLPAPTGMAWTPDGRMLISQDAGQLRVVQNGTLLATPAINLGSRACVQGERGLQSVAVDPAFATNKWIYLFWTYNRHGFCGAGDMSRTPVNRVARYTLGADNRVVAGSEKVLVDNIPSPASHHNGGDIHFGSDGHLYVSTGDGGCTIGDTSRCNELNVNSRRLDIPNGKILRVTKAGGIPDGNPYAVRTGARRCTAPTGVQPGTGPCTETYASGLRNPYRFAKKPAGGFLVNDVGQAHWEEIDNLAAGKNYGWNVREGHCARGSYTDCAATSYQNPMYDYSHQSGCESITGGGVRPGRRLAGAVLRVVFVRRLRLRQGVPARAEIRRRLRPRGVPQRLEFPDGARIRSVEVRAGALLRRLLRQHRPPGDLHRQQRRPDRSVHSTAERLAGRLRRQRELRPRCRRQHHVVPMGFR